MGNAGPTRKTRSEGRRLAAVEDGVGRRQWRDLTPSGGRGIKGARTIYENGGGSR